MQSLYLYRMMLSPLAVALIVFVLLETVVGIVADVLNLKASRKPLPEALRNVYPDEEYRRSQAYLRDKTKLGWLSGATDLALFLGFWLSGGFNLLDQYLRSFGWNSIVTGLAYFAALAFAKGIFGLPFSLYHTFVLEARYGFNKMTWKTWLSDAIKGLGLSVVIGAPLLAAVLWFFESAGPNAWLIVFGVLTAFSLLMRYIAPTWIMPLFNKFTPLPEGELRTAIMEMAEKAGFPLHQVFVMDGSKRSTHSNAFFTGFGKNKRIVLYDTLVEKHTTEELVAILAHEIGHYKKRHIVKGTIVSILHTGVLCFLMGLFLNWKPLFDAFFMEQMSVYAGLLFFGMLFSPLEAVLGPVMNAWSRKHEFEADAFAKKVVGSPTPLAEALKKLAVGNLSNATPHPFYVLMHYSHPPLVQRLEALETA